MARSLDESPDDISRHGRYNGHSRRRGSNSDLGPGPDRRSTYRDQNRILTAYPTRQPRQVTEEAMNRQQPVVPFGEMNTEMETKLYISNLDYGVSDHDLLVLFSDVGELRSYTVHYDRSGRSKGTAEVVFFGPENALAAISRYNGLKLDGKPMKIELVGASVVDLNPVPPTHIINWGHPDSVFGRLPPTQRINWGNSDYVFGRGQDTRVDEIHIDFPGGFGGGIACPGAFGRQDNLDCGILHVGGRGLVGGQSYGVGGGFQGGHRGTGQDNRAGRGFHGRGRGFGGRGPYRNAGQGKKNREMPTIEDLDAQLDKYQAEAKKRK